MNLEPDGPQTPLSQHRAMATVAHCGMVLCAIIVAAVIRATTGRNDPFVRKHATEAVNAQLTAVAVHLAAVAALFISMSTATTRNVTTTQRLGLPMAAGFEPIEVVSNHTEMDYPDHLWMIVAVIVVMWVFMIANAVRAAIASNDIRPFRYPFIIRVVRGGWTKEEEQW